MKKRLCFILIAIFCASYISAQNYIIDSGHSSVQIQVERFGVVDVIGRFKDVQGSIQYNSEDAAKTNASATIKVESYDANNQGGEEAVKSAAFLDAASYPEITFTGIEAVMKEEKYYLKGNLTIHGVSNEIELPFKVNGPKIDLATQKQSIAFNAWITINRQDYGVSFDRQLPNGTKLVGNDVKITLNILAIAE